MADTFGEENEDLERNYKAVKFLKDLINAFHYRGTLLAMALDDNPLYFDIAFQHRDIGMECDFIESALEIYSKTDNRRILDINCGTGPHLDELSGRGYIVDGMETSRKMIDFIKSKPAYQQFKYYLWKDNLHTFSSEHEYGLAINMLTSFNYITTNEEVISHFESVANVLSHGGIYIIEMNHPRDLLSSHTSATNKWIERRDDIEVEMDWDYKKAPLDYIKQIYDLNGRMTIRKAGKEETINSKEKIRIFLFQEIKALIQLSGWFTLIEAFGAFHINQLLDNSRDSWRMLLVLRKE